MSDDFNDFVQRQKQWLIAKREQTHVELSPRDRFRISFALKRVEQEQYGLCCHCGCFIERELLDSTPEAFLCLSCEQEMHQQSH